VNWLRATPGVFVCRPKEPAFHLGDLPIATQIDDRDEYLDLFTEGASGRFRCDATPWYLSSTSATTSIAEMAPDARLVVGLRNPVDLIASLHAHHRYHGIEPEPDLETAVFSRRPPNSTDFRRSLDYLAVARVGSHLQRYRDAFSPEQIYLVRFEELGRRPAATHAALLEWLELPPMRLMSYQRHNPARSRRYEWLHRPIRWMTSNGRPAPVRAMGHRLRTANTVPGRPDAASPLRRRILDALFDDFRLLERLSGHPVTAWWA
jgi:hypothetical protein